MAASGGAPIQIVASGGVPVTNVYGVTDAAGVQIGGGVFTPTDKGGFAATLVSTGGLPVILINDDGTQWEAPE